MKRVAALLLALGLWIGTLTLVAALPLPALAQSNIQFPALTGRVVDNADILTPQQETELTQKLAILEQQTTDQLVVVTLASLDDYDIADYGYQLGRHWGIGQKETNNGALLIVAPNDRKVRIEVGYGLEGILTDAFSALTIQNHILPPFRNGDYYSGINAGVDQLVYQMTLDPEEAAARAVQITSEDAGESENALGFIIIGIIGIFGVIFVIGTVAGAATAGSGRRMQGAADGAGAVLWTTAQILAAIASSSGSGGGGGRSGGGGGGFGGGGGGFGGGGASGGW